MRTLIQTALTLLGSATLLAAPGAWADDGARLTGVVAAVKALSATGDAYEGYSLSLHDGTELTVFADDPPLPGSEHLLESVRTGQPVCLSLNPAQGGGDLAAVAAGACPRAPREIRPPARLVDCRIDGNGIPGTRRKCVFVPAQDGSFALLDPDENGLVASGVSVVTVEMTDPNMGDVRGLTLRGINSRWGEVRRSTRDRACWDGSDFRICAW